MKSVLSVIIVLIVCTAVIGGVMLWRQYSFIPTITLVTPETDDTNGKNTIQEITKSSGKDNTSQKSDVADVPSAPIAKQTDDEHTGNIKTPSDATVKKVKGKMMSKRAAEKVAIDKARKKKSAALEAESAEIEKLVADALISAERFESILSPIFKKGEVKFSESEFKTMVNQIAPTLVQQLNALSADEQYEVIKEVFSMAELAIEEEEAAKHTLLQNLQKHGFKKKF